MRRYILQAGFLLALALVCNLATKIASSQTEVASQLEHSTAETRPDGATRLTNPPTGASDQNPAFSPDGKQLVLTRFETGYNAGPAGLFLLNLQNGIITRLTPWEDQDNVNLPGSAWNPANNRIVFASDRLEADDLWRIAPDGSDFTRILMHTGLPSDIEPSWSPDGSWIVFEADQPGASVDGIVGKIWKVRADGTGLAALTSDLAFRRPTTQLVPWWGSHPLSAAGAPKWAMGCVHSVPRRNRSSEYHQQPSFGYRCLLVARREVDRLFDRLWGITTHPTFSSPPLRAGNPFRSRPRPPMKTAPPPGPQMGPGSPSNPIPDRTKIRRPRCGRKQSRSESRTRRRPASR